MINNYIKVQRGGDERFIFFGSGGDKEAIHQMQVIEGEWLLLSRKPVSKSVWKSTPTTAVYQILEIGTAPEPTGKDEHGKETT